MRISNIQFSKGSIVYADFGENNEFSYLNGKPLVIVSNPIPIFNEVVVCETGTRGKPGISISLWNYYAGKFISGTQLSTVYPYGLHTIQTKTIRNMIGMLDPYIMKKVDDAIKFFMGYSDEVPEFLRNNQQNLFGVTYVPANPSFLSEKLESMNSEMQQLLNRGIQPPLPEEIRMGIESVVDIKEDSDPGAAEVANMKRENHGQEKIITWTKLETDVCRFIEKYCEWSPEGHSTSKDFRAAYEKVAEREKYQSASPISFGKAVGTYFKRKVTPVEVSRVGKNSTGIAIYNGVSIKQDLIDSATNVPAQIITFADPSIDLWSKEKIQSGLFIGHEEEFCNNIPTDDAAYIGTRYAPIEAVMQRYHISEAQAFDLRSRITKKMVDSANSALIQINKNPATINKYDAFTQAGIVIVTDLGKSPLPPKTRIKINHVLNPIRKRFRINVSDRKTWGGLGI